MCADYGTIWCEKGHDHQVHPFGEIESFGMANWRVGDKTPILGQRFTTDDYSLAEAETDVDGVLLWVACRDPDRERKDREHRERARVFLAELLPEREDQ